MPKYVIVQYVPDAVTDERINIGVIVTEAGKARALFLDSWQRVKQFAGKDVSFLKDLQRESRNWDEATVERLTTQWTGSIQFSQPRFSLLTVDNLLVDTTQRFLSDHAAAERGYRAKADAVRLIRSRIREKLTERLGTVGKALIKNKDYELRGTHMAYEFDVSVANGKPLFAAQGISFEVPDTRRLEKEIASTAWLIKDVRDKTADFPIGVAVLPPKGSSERFDDAKKMFAEVGAEVIEEHQFSKWADQRIDGLPDDLKRGRLAN